LLSACATIPAAATPSGAQPDNDHDPDHDRHDDADLLPPDPAHVAAPPRFPLASST
jgi:hypothetical protein